ncbi:hypothetical protein DPMN_087988 [Dreissena polymorpha]|uniref:Uncharacterized protein n=1 Tax=Dreissena polymorpha TaxID=45954 RepID=A0A9D4KTC7_DREPO|nr:hypothetical protein DPMN_087988 [Dreissena polymorpha]
MPPSFIMSATTKNVISNATLIHHVSHYTKCNAILVHHVGHYTKCHPHPYCAMPPSFSM